MCFFEDFFLSIRKNVVLLPSQNGGTVAQLVEQRTENPRVTGSIPVGTTLTETQDFASLFLWFFDWFDRNKQAQKKHLLAGVLY